MVVRAHTIPRCMKLRYSLFLYLFLVLLSSDLSSQPIPERTSTEVSSSPDHPPAERGFIPNVKPELRIARRTGELTLDGELNDDAWQHAEHATNFTEADPLQGSKPRSATEAMLTYDDDYLYVGMIAYDDPSSIRATMTSRDAVFSDDIMGIIIDPFGDQVRAYEMYSNAYGIQADVLWTSNGDDVSYDILYESAGKITDNGYQIELRIPFKSLRFPDTDVQNWRLTFWRNHPRDSHRSYSWASMDRDNPCTFCAFGSLIGLEGVRSGNQLSILPAFVTSQSNARADRGIDNGPIKGEIGISARYAISQSTSLEATINPDFSQIESDATQIDLNSTTALYYPERRPFFREGYDLLDTWVDVVYTRSINDPLAAFKTLSRSGSTNFAFLGAMDEHSPLVIPLEERTAQFALGRSYSGILRGVHNFDGNNALGAIGTVRDYDGLGWNAVVGADAKLQVLDNLMFESQQLFSFTDGLENRGLFGDAPLPGSQSASQVGYASYASLERFSNAFDIDVDFWQYSPAFRAANGYVSRSNQRSGHLYSTYKWYFDSTSWLVRIGPDLGAGAVWNFQGKQKDEWLVPGLVMIMKAQTEMGLSYMWSAETFSEQYFPGIRRFNLWANSAPVRALSFGGSTQLGHVIYRSFAAPELSRLTYYDLYLTWKPTDNFSFSPSFISEKLDHMQGGNIYEIALVRSRLNYQINKELSVRLVMEYNDYDHTLSLEPLVTYRINPFSVFYLGSSHGYESFGQQRLLDKQESHRQIFAKIQYLFQV